MDEKTKAEMAYIINTLRGDLDYAKAEISRLDFEDEAAKKDGDTHGPNAAGGIQKRAERSSFLPLCSLR